MSRIEELETDNSYGGQYLPDIFELILKINEIIEVINEMEEMTNAK